MVRDRDTAMPVEPLGRTADPERFSQLVREHYAAALRYAGRLLRQDSEAEDCVQEAFAEVFTQLHTLRDPDSVAGWIRGIVRHRCLRRLRRRDLQLVPFASELDALGAAPRSAPLEGRAEQRSFARWLLELLPAHERALVTLFYFKECSQQEIASFLGLPLSTVNNRLHDARKRMKAWETYMETRPHTASSAEQERLSRIGRLVHLNGPLVEARFDPDTSFDLFDALAVVGQDGAPVERMKVCHRLGDGRVQCLLTGGNEPLHPGMSVLNTGRIGIAPTPLSRVLSVSAENLLRAVDALRGATTRAPRLLETGVKAIDLLCPLSDGGVVAQVGTAGVGRIVLLDELAERLAHAHELSVLCLVDRSEPDAYRGWEEATLRGSVDGMRFYWALSAQGTDPRLGALDAADAALYLSPLLAVLGLYPAIDPQQSRSRLLRPELVGAEHCQVAARVREALGLAKRVYTDPVLLELLACRAFAAAQQRAAAFEPNLDGVDAVQLARGRKLQKFLTQPFETARELTGWPGVHVSVADTVAGCRAILDGEVDMLPEQAFAYAGTLEHVRELAREGASRSFYR